MNWCTGYHYCTTSFLKGENMPWCSGYHYCAVSFNKAWTQVLCRFKSCLQRVGDLRWWGSLTVVPAGNKAKCLLSVNHCRKTIHHQLLIHSVKHWPSLVIYFELWTYIYQLKRTSEFPLVESWDVQRRHILLRS